MSEARIEGVGALSDLLGDNVVYRSLAPVNTSLPNLASLVGQLGIAPGTCPRKTEIDYARVVAEILKAALANRNGGSVERLSAWHEQGLRAFQIAYEGDNELGGGFDRDDTRITPLGKTVVAELNRLGIVVDVSHCGRRTTLDVAMASSRPVMATRGNPEKLSSHGRNKTDKELKTIAGTGGVVGATNISRYLRSHEAHQPEIRDYVEHVDYLVQLLGIDHVGFSSEGWLDDTLVFRKVSMGTEQIWVV